MSNLTLDFSKQMAEWQDETIAQTVNKERRRLFDFIRRRVPKAEDAEDILQDVFYELTESYRLMKPAEKVASWLFTVARNKITDWYRKKRPEAMPVLRGNGDDEAEMLNLAELIPNDNTADGELMRSMIMNALQEALDELPDEQRDVFILNEIDEKTFREISEETGVPLNTLLSRKRYAVLHLRSRLQHLYNEMFN